MTADMILDNTIERYPVLKVCKKEIEAAYNCIVSCYEKGGKLLICGNGGSATDSDHIVAELMKGFMKKRVLPEQIRKRLLNNDPEKGKILAEYLQGSLPAIALTNHNSLNTAFSNDVNPELVFAQQVMGYGKKGDVLLAISTTGMSKNLVYAAYLAETLDIKTIAMTGQSESLLSEMCDHCIRVPEKSTPLIQELHLPVYHTICAILEEHFF